MDRTAHIETGLEVALMPAEAYDKERNATGRVAALLVFRAYVPKPHRVFLPPVYDSRLRRIYARLDDSRELVPALGSVPVDSVSKAR